MNDDLSFFLLIKYTIYLFSVLLHIKGLYNLIHFFAIIRDLNCEIRRTIPIYIQTRMIKIISKTNQR